MSKLSMQLVPQQAHGRNLRKILKPASWKTLSMAIRGRDKVCVHCEGMAEHCHEVWEWVVVEGRLLQRLTGLEGVCKDCHDFMHFGLVSVCESRARQDVVLGHAIAVMTCDPDWMMTYINGCFSAHYFLSALPLVEDMDLSWCFETPEVGLGIGVDIDWIVNELYDYVHHGEEEYTKDGPVL